MSIDLNDPRITAYVLGELQGELREQFEAEMAASAELQQVVRDTQQAVDMLSEELGQESTAGMHDEQKQAVHAAIDAGDSSMATKPNRSRGRPLGALLAIAVSLVTVAALGSLWLASRAARDGYQLASYFAPQNAVPGHAEGSARGDRSLLDAGVADERANGPAKRPYVGARFEEREESRAAELAKGLAADPAAYGPRPARARAKDEPASEGLAGNADIASMASPASQTASPQYGQTSGRSLQELRFSDAEHAQPIRGGDRQWNLALKQDQVIQPDEGLGPGRGGDKYDLIVENDFKQVQHEPLSTFSIDVDTASYAKVRTYLMQQRMLPRPDAVRIEELVNYFTYDYEPPSGDDPFAAHIEVAECPWRPEHRLVRIGIKGKEIVNEERPHSNLVFLLDVSGSMNQPNKLPLLKQGMRMLAEQLGENDRVAIVVYAGAAGMVLDSTPGSEQSTILESLERLRAGGSTNGGQGIRLAYQTALDNFVEGGVNRVILCTDGDFNVGTTGTDSLVRLVEENAKSGVFLSVLGFGMGNHNDAMLEQISNKGNGNYAYIDTEAEAHKVLVEQMSGTLVTIAKDVKIQVEFNPNQVSAYRLIGYENRILAAEDFNDDKKDAGEIGAGHSVTALYQVVPAGKAESLNLPDVDELRYQKQQQLTEDAESGELLTLKMRYKQPDGDASTKLTFPVTDQGQRFGQATEDFRFAAAVASFGMLLRGSEHAGNATYAGVEEIANAAAGDDAYRQEFLQMVARARELAGQ